MNSSHSPARIVDVQNFIDKCSTAGFIGEIIQNFSGLTEITRILGANCLKTFKFPEFL
jgi:hypothetical protein